MSTQSNGLVSPTPLLRIGDLLWCREGRNSKLWWPAMVSYDPKRGIYFRTHSGRVSQYHVQYFGISAVRGWVYVQSTQELKDPQDKPLPEKGVTKKVRTEFDVALQEASQALLLSHKQRKLKFIFSFGPTLKPKVKVAPQASASVGQDQVCDTVTAGKKAAAHKKKLQLTSDCSLRNLDKNSLKQHPLSAATSMLLDSPSLSSSQSSIPDEVFPSSGQPHQIGTISLPTAAYVSGGDGTSDVSFAQLAPKRGTKRRGSHSEGRVGLRQRDSEAVLPPSKKPALNVAPSSSHLPQVAPLPLALAPAMSDSGSEASAPSIASAILTPPSSCTGDPPSVNFEFERAAKEEVKVEATAPAKKPQSRPATPKEKPVLGEGSCCICDEDDSDLLLCRGHCFRMFHLDCIGLMVVPDFNFVCDDCQRAPSECFACKKGGGELYGCSKPKCSRFYHLDCTKGNKLFTLEQKKGSRVSLTCALHSCARCTSIGKTQVHHFNTIQCIKCPLALHRPDCLIAGCEILDHTHMICYQHLKIEQNVSLYGHMNLNTCLECGKPGTLFCCDICSAAYHLLCLDEDTKPRAAAGEDEQGGERGKEEEVEQGVTVGGEEQVGDKRKVKEEVVEAGGGLGREEHTRSGGEEETEREGDPWKCPNCVVHDLPTYGSMVMSKFARWRWWPGEVVLPNAIPKNIVAKKPGRCMFVVKFCGSGDYGWTYHGRTIPYLPEEMPAEGGEGGPEECAKKNGWTPKGYLSSSANVFGKACLEAKELYQVKRAAKAARMRPGSKRYIKIKSNKYLVPRPPLEDDSHSISCQCTPENPCNDDSVCVNRASYFECSPDTCPVGELCQNQRMMKCQNADSYTFYTGARGWGLKTNHDIKEGDFVVEYVGEILDTAMCKERLRKSHEESTINFYMLTLEPGLVIDASQKSNHARFINHSCDPNCETQKWTVRGETRIGIFARQDIPKGTELTFDYHLDTLGNDKKRCLCGSKKCSGFLGLKLKGEPHRANPNKPKKAAKPKAKRRHSKQPVKLLPELDVDRHEDDCFVCGDGGELLLCDRQMCSKAYHLPCIGRKVVPPKHTKWECPRHYCQVCQKSATVFCVSCPVSFCDKHRVARFLDENGQLYCLENCRMTFSDCQQDSSGIDQL